ncbi:MAG: hypothetical protein WCC94_02845 [Candidatus Bathyarchaeia archaeon]
MLRFDETGRPQIVTLVETAHEDGDSTGLNWDDVADMEMLEIMGSVDLTLFSEEYRRSHPYVRLKLRGFEATFSELQSKIRAPIHGEAYVLIHRTGFAIMSFWLSIRQSTLDLNDLMSLEQSEATSLRTIIWRGLAEEYAKVSLSMRKILTSDRHESSQSLSIVTNIETLSNIYAFCIVTKGLIGDISSIEELEKKLRYYPIGRYPLISIRNIGGSALEKFVNDHKFELHGILTKEKYWDWVGQKWVDYALRENLAWRSDWAVYIGYGASLLMTAPSVTERFLEIKALKQPKDSDQQLELEYRGVNLDVVNIVEVLKLQEIMLRTYDYVLSVGPPRSILGLTNLKQSLTEGLEEYQNVRIWPHKTAQEWVEFGQRIMNIDKIYAVVQEKFKLLEGRLRTQYDVRLNRLVVALAVLFGSTQVGQLAAALGWSQWSSLFICMATLALGLLAARVTRII